MIYGVILLFVLLGLPLGTIVARDMDRRGLDGRIYGALTFFLVPVGVVVWLVERSRHPVVDGPGEGG